MNNNEKDISKAYDARLHEQKIYSEWEKNNLFAARPDAPQGPFCITMPPPNTTGQLHLGHASTMAYEDLMIRYKRLRGFDALYIPGTDHAAIATQNKVERLLTEEGKTRHDLGREKFLERVRSYVADTQSTMKSQIRSMGASCDWTREAYTFDDVSSRVVNEVFIKMYNDGLIYRGNRIVNWCTRCNSVLADDEVNYIEKKTPFYYFKYGPVVIGTARPETKFQDKIIIVHPDDKRYKKIIGKEFDVEWIEGTVKAKVISDKAADPEMGTGAMTITPAHSFEDFELAKKYKIPIELIINTEGKLTKAAGSMAGLDVESARKKVVEVLIKKGLVDHIDENYTHNLSVCYRCETPVQPLTSEQWFVDVSKKIKGRGKSLKELATELVENDDIHIIPPRFKKIYMNWMDNLHDWCISRQIWWGHRIPVWYGENDEVVASSVAPGDTFRQDEDTLDTWFSSATWTFSTLLNRDNDSYKNIEEWINDSPDLKRYHPTAVLETGYDILFFWIARMVLITSYVLDEKPFDNVYLHGMIRDKQGRKMSKSLGNGIDPTEVIEKYGADALRLSLVIGSAPGQDMRLYDEKIAGYRNFVNKLWNISRYVLMTISDVKIDTDVIDLESCTYVDRAIVKKLDQLISEVTKDLDEWRFSVAGEKIYQFTWSEFADWYIELSKSQAGNTDQRDRVLVHILKKLLVLWHPFAPYITEVIWKELGQTESIMIQEWPSETSTDIYTADLKKYESLKDAIRTIRIYKKAAGIGAGQTITIGVTARKGMEGFESYMESVAKCKIETITGPSVEVGSFVIVFEKAMYEKAAAAKKKEKDALEKFIDSLEKKLSNKKFVKNAPENIVAQEKEKLAEAKKKLSE